MKRGSLLTIAAITTTAAFSLLVLTAGHKEKKLKKQDKNEGSPEEMLKNLGDFFKMISGNGSCEFTCSEGLVPVPKKGHVPSTNGCGSMGIKLDTSAFPQFETCCDKHDRCYDTCGRNREKCDTQFDTCLDSVCKKVKQRGMLQEKVTVCESSAGVMKAAASGLGCSAYKSAQEKACECKPSGIGHDNDDDNNDDDNDDNNDDDNDNNADDDDDDDDDDDNADDDDDDDDDKDRHMKSSKQEIAEDFFDKVEL